MESSRMLRAVDIPFGVLTVVAAAVALSLLPFWFEQAMAYSDVVGVAGASEKAVAAACSCRADVAAATACAALGFSMLVRLVSLRITRSLSVGRATAWTLGEHAAALVAYWFVAYAFLRADPLSRAVRMWSDAWCAGGR